MASLREKGTRLVVPGLTASSTIHAAVMFAIFAALGASGSPGHRATYMLDYGSALFAHSAGRGYEPGRYAGRGCFVLCVTPSSGGSRNSRILGSSGKGERSLAAAATDTIYRTRAGALSSGFLEHTIYGRRRNQRRRGVGSNGLECKAGDEIDRDFGEPWGRFRWVLNRMGGVRRISDPPAAGTVIYENQVVRCSSRKACPRDRLTFFPWHLSFRVDKLVMMTAVLL